MLNFNMPLIVDDYGYAIYGGYRNPDISQIFDSMYKHYFEWGGRVLVHGIAQFFLWQPHYIFAVLNSLVFTLLIFLLCVHAAAGLGSFTLWPMPLFAFVVVSCFAPRFGQDVLWLTGSCNYLWGTCAVALALLPFSLRICGNNYFDGSLVLGLLTVIISFFAGWTTEGGGVTLIFAQFFMMVFLYMRERVFKIWMVLAFLASALGWLIMIAAPGNFVRLALDPDGLDLIGSFIKIFGSYLDPEFLLYPMITLLFLMQLPVFRDRKVKNAVILAILILLASTFCFVASPSYVGRVQFLPACIATVILMIPLYRIQLHSVEQKRLCLTLYMLLVAIVGNIFFVTGHDVRHLKKFYDQVATIVQNEKESDRDEILIPDEIFFKSESHFGPDYGLAVLSHDPDVVVNKLLGKYYETDKTIRLVNRELNK